VVNMESTWSQSAPSNHDGEQDEREGTHAQLAVRKQHGHGGNRGITVAEDEEKAER